MTSLCVALGAAFVHRGVRPVLIEADPAGGVIGLRFAKSADPSLRTLWADMRRGYSPELVLQNSIDLRGIDCLLAPTDPSSTARALEHVAPVLAREVHGLQRPVIIDLGRLSDSSQALPFLSSATHVLVVTRPRVEDAQSLLYGTRLLEAHGSRPAIVSIGDGPHHPAEMAALAGLPLAAILPDDRATSCAFSGGDFVARKLRRSTLWRCVDSLADQLSAGSPAVVPDVPPVPAAMAPTVAPSARIADPATVPATVAPSPGTPAPPPPTVARPVGTPAPPAPAPGWSTGTPAPPLPSTVGPPAACGADDRVDADLAPARAVRTRAFPTDRDFWANQDSTNDPDITRPRRDRPALTKVGAS